MKRTNKTVLPVLLALLIAAAVIPLTTLAAKAANADDEKTLVDAVNAGGTVTMVNDISLTGVLRIPTGKEVILDLNGFTLNRGLTSCVDLGSVIRVEPGAVLTLKDSSNDNTGVITGGASWNGGGICNHGTLTVEGGTISGNKALHSTYGGGGGIFNGSYQGSQATLTLKGGVIAYNEARNGGGVYNSDGTLIIEKGSYSVTVLSQLKTYETNVTIKNNTANSKGSGIYTENGLSLKDAPYISGNTNDDDLTLIGGKVMKITGKLRIPAKIGVKAGNQDTIITSGYFSYETEDPNVFFKSTDPNAIIRMSNTKENGGEVMLKSSSKSLVEVYKGTIKKTASALYVRQEYSNPAQAVWTAFSAMHSLGATYRIELTLGADYSFDGCITVPKNGYLVVDLNGHTIKRTRNGKKKDDGGVFVVQDGATLTINDSNPTRSSGYSDIKGGIIMGGANSNGGGGITVETGGILYMNGGTIYQCSSDYAGGGICAKQRAKLIVLKKCAIVSCKTDDSLDDCDGGGIYAKMVYRLELENVTVKNCYSEDYGGGVYYYGGNNGIFIVSACTFTGNKANDDGGAVYYSSSEGGYFDKTFFSSNYAGDDGGAIYAIKNGETVYSAKKDEPVMIRECAISGNYAKDEGSAVFVDREDVVFVTDSITGNHAEDKGAVYVSHNAGRYGYDISVKGQMVIALNTSGTSNRSNIVLENYGATHNYIYCAGLYPGSNISFSVLEGGKVEVLRNVDAYQLRYFHSEYGSLSFSGQKAEEVPMATASFFSTGSFIVIIVLAGVAVLLVIGALIYKKKKKNKKGGADDNDKED